MHISHERRKLDSKSRKCLLLRYGTVTKGYRLYDSQIKKVFYSRDVVFNEKEYGYSNSSITQPKTVHIETLKEPETEGKTEPRTVVRRSERTRSQPNYYGECMG